MPIFEAIRLGKLLTGYESEQFLFQNVSFTLDHGRNSKLVIRGPSGCGKTTLLRCLAGLDTFDHGKPFLGEKTPEQLGLAVWRSRVLYLPQRAPPLETTPLEFYTIVSNFKTYKPSKLTADTTNTASVSPQTIAKDWNLPFRVWHTPMRDISGGELQRAMLAIALSLDPPVLLLDECMAALDDATKILVEKSLQGRVFIWVGHDEKAEQRLGITQVVDLSPGGGSRKGGGGSSVGSTGGSPSGVRPKVKRKKTNGSLQKSKKGVIQGEVML